MSYAPTEPTPVAVAVNRDAKSLYDLADRQDFADAERSLIARYPDSPPNPDGNPSALAALAGLMDEFDPNFNIVTP